MYRAGDLLKEVLTRAGVDPRAPQTLIYRTWDELLGADLAGRARLRDIDHGRLLVEVDHPASLQLIRMRQRTILRRVQRRFPVLGVRRLQVVVGAGVGAVRDEPAEERAAAVDAHAERPPPAPALPDNLRGDAALADVLTRLYGRLIRLRR